VELVQNTRLDRLSHDHDVEKQRQERYRSTVEGAAVRGALGQAARYALLGNGQRTVSVRDPFTGMVRTVTGPTVEAAIEAVRDEQGEAR